MKERWGVIVIDVQGDFTEMKRGSLAVPGTGEEYVREVEEATRRLKEAGLVIFGTQDWHPAGHVSFASSHPGKKPFESIVVNGRTQVLWPPHCVQGTENARVLIDNNLFLAIVKKAQNPAFDSYSAFRDDGGAQTELDAMLRTNEIKTSAHLWVGDRLLRAGIGARCDRGRLSGNRGQRCFPGASPLRPRAGPSMR